MAIEQLASGGAKPRLGDCRVTNLGSLASGGTHWTCFHIGADRILYYDSFGMPPPDALVQYWKRLKPTPPVVFSDSQMQAVLSTKCGYYCVRVLRDLARGKSDYDVIYGFDQEPSQANERRALTG